MKITIGVLIGIIIVGALIVFVGKESPQIKLGQGPISPNMKLGTNATITATTTAKLWLADSSGSRLRKFGNIGIYDCFYSATTTNLAANYGAFIKASSTELLSGESLIQGNIYGICGGTSTISVFQM